jgi:hypothetical protein
MNILNHCKLSALIAAFVWTLPALPTAALAQDLRPVALEINNFARVCSGPSKQDARQITMMNASADPQDAAVSTERARSMIASLEYELSRFDSLTIVDPRAFGRSLDAIWDVWRQQSNLVSMSWDKISVDVVLLMQGGPGSSLRFVIHNPRTGCTKYIGPVPLAPAVVAPKAPDLPPPPTPSHSSPPTPAAPACGWYAIAFCRTHDREAEVRQWNDKNARARVIDTGSSAFPNFSPGWFCVVSGPHDKAAAAAIESRWKANGWSTSYIKNACK